MISTAYLPGNVITEWDRQVLDHIQKWFDAAGKCLIKPNWTLNPIMEMEVLKDVVKIILMGRRKNWPELEVVKEIEESLKISMPFNFFITNKSWIAQDYFFTPPDGFCSYHIMYQLKENWEHKRDHGTFLAHEKSVWLDHSLSANADVRAKLISEGFTKLESAIDKKCLFTLPEKVQNAVRHLSEEGGGKNENNDHWTDQRDSGYLWLHEQQIPFAKFVSPPCSGWGK